MGQSGRSHEGREGMKRLGISRYAPTASTARHGKSVAAAHLIVMALCVRCDGVRICVEDHEEGHSLAHLLPTISRYKP